MKKRFMIIKLLIRFSKNEDTDVFFTCGILHNMLSAFGGMGVLKVNVNWAGRTIYTAPGCHHSQRRKAQVACATR